MKNSSLEIGEITDVTKRYRYSLWRRWDSSKPRILFICLNPRTEVANFNGPTIKRCLGFAERWGFGSLEMVNLFAFRADRHYSLVVAQDPVGQENDKYIKKAVDNADTVIVAWGTKGTLHKRNEQVLQLISDRKKIYCLEKTKEGHPKHPLYVKSGIETVVFQKFIERG